MKNKDEVTTKVLMTSQQLKTSLKLNLCIAFLTFYTSLRPCHQEQTYVHFSLNWSKNAFLS